MDRLPDFLVIGAMKAGTTALFEYLRRHPQIFVPAKKELDFFSRDANVGLDRYSEWFHDADDALVAGEASTSYTKFPTHVGVPARIATALPTVRLIYVIRQPVDRIRAQYVHEVWQGDEVRTLEESVMNDSRYLDYSRYRLQLDQYFEFFDPRQILLCTSEQLRHQRRSTVQKIFEFLGVDPDWWSTELDQEFHVSATKLQPRRIARWLRKNAAYRTISRITPSAIKPWNDRWFEKPIRDEATAVSPELRRHIEDALRDDVRSLRPLLGEAIDHWRID